MHWGYYCRTCGASSEALFDEPRPLWKAFNDAQNDFETVDGFETIIRETLSIRILAFLAHHYRHDVWAECENGVLRLGNNDKPYDGACLPQRFRTLGA